VYWLELCSPRGAERILPGTSEVDDKVKDLGTQLKRELGAKEMYN